LDEQLLYVSKKEQSLMKSRYNIGLIPATESDQIIAFAKNFSTIADKYLLGEKSIPHVTICQFVAEESHLANIWEDVCKSLERLSVELTFEKFSCVTAGNSFWVSLLPDDCETLNVMQNTVKKLVKNPVKNTFDYYDPHMTLIDTKEEKYEDTVKKLSASYIPIKDTFVVSLGKSDDLGQLTEVIFYCEIQNRKKFTM
jgi:2'-5' RNA ligase